MVNVAERPNTIDDTIEEINRVLYPDMYIAVVIYCWWYLSRLPQQSGHLVPCDTTVTTERLSGMEIMHVHKEKTSDKLFSVNTPTK